MRIQRGDEQILEAAVWQDEIGDQDIEIELRGAHIVIDRELLPILQRTQFVGVRNLFSGFSYYIRPAGM